MTCTAAVCPTQSTSMRRTADPRPRHRTALEMCGGVKAPPYRQRRCSCADLSVCALCLCNCTAGQALLCEHLGTEAGTLPGGNVVLLRKIRPLTASRKRCTDRCDALLSRLVPTAPNAPAPRLRAAAKGIYGKSRIKAKLEGPRRTPALAGSNVDTMPEPAGSGCRYRCRMRMASEWHHPARDPVDPRNSGIQTN